MTPDTPVLTLLKRIKSGEVDAASLSKEGRQSCVEVLFFEGYSVAEMAEILKKSDKTIRRDIEDIRQKNALAPDPKLATQLIGQMVEAAHLRQGRLTKLASSKDGSVSERAQAEYLAWRVYKEMMEKLQSLGYLPSRPVEIVGDFTHHDGQTPLIPMKSLDEVAGIILEIKATAEKTGSFDPAVVREVAELEAELEKARLTGRALGILNKQTAQNESTENQDEK